MDDVKPVEVVSDSGWVIHQYDGGAFYYLVLQQGENGSHHEARDPVVEAMSQTIGYSQVNSMGNKYPMQAVIKTWAAIEREAKDYDVKIPEAISAYVTKLIEERRKQLESNLKKGLIEYGDLTVFFEEGMEIVGDFRGHLVGGIVESVEPRSSWGGNFTVVNARVISNISGHVAENKIKLIIRAFDKLAKLDELTVRVASEQDKKVLTERGERYRKMTSSPAYYAHYQGQLVQNSYWGSNSYRGDGRVMLDIQSMIKTQNNRYSNESHSSGLDRHDREDDTVRTSMAIEDKNLWRCYPFLYGFSFNAKQWGRLDVDGLSEINWRTDSWDKLVLDDDKKELVKALVEHHGEGFTDIVDEKGGGVIFLLHGPPGEGKTLTMETIAELLHKPLYRVSIGELGVSPDQLEDRLRQILEIATVWDAVVGLDEADIFLEAREKSDILRNAMVGVFLRLTEYHQGVLFLTTNLVDNIDAAFESRISVQVGFKKGTREKRLKIWKNILDAAKITDNLDVEELANFKLNGRQIKNVIRQSQTLAKARGVSISMEIIHGVVKVTKRKKKKKS